MKMANDMPKIAVALTLAADWLQYGGWWFVPKLTALGWTGWVPASQGSGKDFGWTLSEQATRERMDGSPLDAHSLGGGLHYG